MKNSDPKSKSKYRLTSKYVLGNHAINAEITSPRNEIMISSLLNRHLFRLEDVLIAIETRQSKIFFQLLILHKGVLLWDKFYTSLSGAKYAFLRHFSDRADGEIVRPDWSHFYFPEKKWLEQKRRKNET